MQIRFRSNPFGENETAKTVHRTKLNVLCSLIYEIHKLEHEIRSKDEELSVRRKDILINFEIDHATLLSTVHKSLFFGNVVALIFILIHLIFHLIFSI